MTSDRYEPWMSIKEAAEYTGMTEKALRERIAEIPGAGRTRGTSGDWRVKPSALDAYLTGRVKDEG
jgi:hypothetical protein